MRIEENARVGLILVGRLISVFMISSTPGGTTCHRLILLTKPRKDSAFGASRKRFFSRHTIRNLRRNILIQSKEYDFAPLIRLLKIMNYPM